MSDDVVTTNLSRYGYRELAIAAKLIKAYAESPLDCMGDGITLNFNSNSGYVFLSDEDGTVGMLNSEDNLQQFFSCPECGYEGFLDEFEKDSACEGCRKIAGGED